jgi:hypothetical protein
MSVWGDMMIDTPTQLPPAKRGVGFLLGIGILFLPFVFVWFLLRRGHGTLSRIIGFGWLALVMLLAVGQGSGTKSPSAPEPKNVTGSVSNASSPEAAVPTGGKWAYDSSTDAMRGTTSHFANIDSDNKLDFKFPYGGGSTGTLTLRKDPKLNVILRVDKGQFLCDEFSHTSVSVKFDDGLIERFRCNSPSDGRANEIFIEGETKFVNHLRHASKLVIESEFFQEGRRQLLFDVRGLNWD